jgi:hypothetical protein
MAREWHELTRLTGGAPITIERVRIAGSDIAVEGSFELPKVAQLPAGDQVFIAAFVRSHGSIKEMERIFGVSYPTIKKRLTQIGDQLPLVQTLPPAAPLPPAPPSPAHDEVLAQLERGDISAAEAIERLSQ